VLQNGLIVICIYVMLLLVLLILKVLVPFIYSVKEVFLFDIKEDSVFIPFGTLGVISSSVRMPYIAVAFC
jgi:hypothetical protein